MAFNGEFFEIFSSLPAKSFCRFTSVSKSCKEFAFENLFVKKQCFNMQLNGDSSFAIQPNSCRRYKDKLELHSLNSSDGSSFSYGIPPKSLEFLKNTGRILASSNGLICCRNIKNSEKSLFICNPATQSWFPIPTPNCLNSTEKDFKLVFECNNGFSADFPRDYTLMVLMEDTDDWASTLLSNHVYSPKQGIWEERGKFNTGGRSIDFDMPVNDSNGTIYFLSDCSFYMAKNSPFYWPYIVGYDIKKCASRFLAIPKDARRGLHDQRCRMSIFKWKNSLCLVKLRKSVFSVWVLIDSNSSKWSRILKMRVQAMVGLMELNPIVAGFTVLNGRSLLIATGEKVYRYNLTSERSEKAEEICRHECGRSVFFHSYSNTLRPCGDGAMPLPT